MKTSARRPSTKDSESPVSVVENGSSLKQKGNGGGFDSAVLLATLLRMRDGDFAARLPSTWTGLEGKVADTFNDIVAANEQMARELKRLGQTMGKEGRTRERARFQQLRGSWAGPKSFCLINKHNSDEKTSR